MMTVDPAALAEQLPDHPLDRDPLGEIADQLGWHILIVPDPRLHDRCTQAFLFDGGEETPGRAMAVRFDPDEGWIGEVIRESVTLKEWTEVNTVWAEDIMGAEVLLEKVETEVNGETVVWEWNRDDR